MKKIIPLITVIVLGCFQNSDAQTLSYSCFGDTILNCQNSIHVILSIGSMPETAGIITVDWGDGNTSNQNYSTLPGFNSHSEEITHSYSNPGNYTVYVSVYSGTAGSSLGFPQMGILHALGSTSCGYQYIHTVQQTTNYLYENVPYQFIDINGSVAVLTPSVNPVVGTMIYSGLNPSNAPYTCQIDPDWLTANNLTQETPNFTITSFDQSGMPDIAPQTMVVDCSIPSSDPDFGVNFGWASNFTAPLQTGDLFVEICNNACYNSSDVSVTIQLPEDFIPDINGLINPVINGNTLTFDIIGLSECELLQIPFTFPGSTPAGTIIGFAVLLSNPNDAYLDNNQKEITGTVLNSYDPNEKIVDQPTIIAPDTKQELQYVIHFQNDGNLNAATIVVKDTISENLDLSTFKFIGSKHGVTTSINESTREITFTFNGINLEQSAVDLDASQGFVIYSISENPGLPVGSVIENTAYIYFDFNPVIITNTTYNINQLPLGLDESKSEWVNIYPNPAEDKITFSGASVNEVSIYDLTGKLVLNAANILDNEISVNKLQTGIYQVILKTNNRVSTQKLVIKK